ncbi:glycosyltransferase family 2 protein [Microbacterium telephonicum]|uniref:Galactosyltransferase-like protein n=1 Tax=Microbacterium telephonicum TaxID=1714841 RepID=A0A498CBT1_9MICO|nr:galactosyltransferase-related protein [Microbacterium telephonicum]RLK52569.1 galactosyltransferase-like protein [Microbacterium telephonicum]
MSAPDRVAVISLCSTERVEHLRRQLAATAAGPGIERIVVWIGADAPPPLPAETVLTVPPAPEGLRLAAARNAGAEAAIAGGAELLIFLDADCIPGPRLVARYRRAADSAPDAVLCGPVTYLPPGAGVSADELTAATAPHPARPAPDDDDLRRAIVPEYPLFWSLSFALTPATWERSGGFDEAYVGYGGEDTDFAFRLRERRIPLWWVGGAHAYHQHHPTSSPPWQHLDDILRNGAIFARTWGEWPMTGWLESFADAGAVRREVSGWVRA